MELGTMEIWVRGNVRPACGRLTHKFGSYKSLHSDLLRLNPTYSGLKKIKITSRVRFAPRKSPWPRHSRHTLPTSSAMCPPCPRTPVYYVSGLYTNEERAGVRSLIKYKKLPNELIFELPLYDLGENVPHPSSWMFPCERMKMRTRLELDSKWLIAEHSVSLSSPNEERAGVRSLIKYKKLPNEPILNSCLFVVYKSLTTIPSRSRTQKRTRFSTSPARTYRSFLPFSPSKLLAANCAGD
jgi:hypothetical protein